MGPLGTRIVGWTVAATAAAWLGCTPEERVVQTITDELSADGLTSLDIDVEDGDLQVTGDASLDRIEAALDLVTPRSGTGQDDKALDAIHMELRETGDGRARLHVWMEPNVARYSLELRASVPADLPLAVAVDDGFTRVEGCGDIEVDDGDGELTVLDMVGTVQIVDKAGTFLVDGVTGTVIVDDGADDFEVTNVDGDVEIDDGAGDMVVSHVTGTATIRDGAGDIHVIDVGTLNPESDSSGSLLIE